MTKFSKNWQEPIDIIAVPTNGWQSMDSCPRLDYEEYLVLVPHPDESGLTHRIAMWDPEDNDFNVFMASWNPEPIYWQHLPQKPGETLKPDEERQRIYDEALESAEEGWHLGHDDTIPTNALVQFEINIEDGVPFNSIPHPRKGR